jgi:hypothetical protein
MSIALLADEVTKSHSIKQRQLRSKQGIFALRFSISSGLQFGYLSNLLRNFIFHPLIPNFWPAFKDSIQDTESARAKIYLDRWEWI